MKKSMTKDSVKGAFSSTANSADKNFQAPASPKTNYTSQIQQGGHVANEVSAPVRNGVAKTFDKPADRGDITKRVSPDAVTDARAVKRG